MRKGPSTCKKYREEFQEAERNDDAFKCKQCDQHPDWHERSPAPPATQPALAIETLLAGNQRIQQSLEDIIAYMRRPTGDVANFLL
mmetsp:Transcript_15682/g.21464  ORF Transcript_15682/g.21464 Transcript_15682/m.21464 type:complete len:86 (-) Transcript_15682:1117-1374(-)